MGTSKSLLIGFFFLSFLISVFYLVYAWDNPTSSPPTGGGYLQTQSGQLLITKPTRVTSGNNFVVENGKVGIGTINPLQSLHLKNGHLRLEAIAAPPAPTATVNTSPGNLNGTYYYAITFVTPWGETELGDFSNPVYPTNQQVNLTIPVSSDSSVIARKIYRTDGTGYTKDGVPLYFFLVTTINDNTTTSYTDNLPDSSLGEPGPRFNTTGGIIFNGSEKIVVVDRGTTAIGLNALRRNGGYLNTAVGINALATTTIGSFNTAVGAYALYYNEDGDYNVAVGFEALRGNRSGYGNTALGYRALYNSYQTGIGNTAVGYAAIYSNESGNYNTAVGFGAFYSNVYGSYNIAIGHDALSYATSSDYNVAIGAKALFLTTSGYGNTAVGSSALYNNTTGYENVGIGDSALYSNTSGYRNIGIGVDAGTYTRAGNPNETSNNSIYIGYNARSSASGNTNEIVIGANAIGLGSNTVVLGNDNIVTTALKGNVGIGTTTPGTRLAVVGLTSSQAGRSICSDANGNFYYYAGACTASSLKYKTNISDLNLRGLDIVMKLRPVTFEYKKDYGAYDGTIHTGFIAEDVANVAPILVDYLEGAPNGVRYNELTAILVKAVQEQQRQIEELKARLERLENRY